MPIDPGIYGAFQRPPRSVAEITNALLANDRAGLENGLMAQKADEYRRGVADDAQMRDLVRASGGDPAALRTALVQRGDVKALDAHDKGQMELAKGTAEIGFKGAQTQEHQAGADVKRIQAMRDGAAYAAQGLAKVNVQDDASIVDWYKDAVTKGLIKSEDAIAEINKVPPAGPAREQWKAQQQQAGMTMIEQANKQLEGQRNSETNRSNVARETETGRHNVSTEKTAQGQLGVAQGHLQVARDKVTQETAVGGTEGFTPAAIENAAARYNVDGTLPPMGMGKAGSQGRQAILNKAAELAAGTSGTDQRAGQLDNKSTAAALSAVSKQRNMVASFEKTANANADMALDLSNKVDRTNVPIFNKWLQAGRTGTGSVEASQFNAANTTFVNEYAKIMSGSMGNTAVSDAARKHAEDVIGTANSKEQYAGVMKTLKAEMSNRMKGFEDQETELRDRLKGAKPESKAKSVSWGELK